MAFTLAELTASVDAVATGKFVTDRFVQKVAEEKAEERIGWLKKLLVMREKAVTDKAKVKPTFRTFDEQLRPIGPATFTDQQVKELNALNATIAKIDAAVDAGLSRNDWTQAQKLADGAKDAPVRPE